MTSLNLDLAILGIRTRFEAEESELTHRVAAVYAAWSSVALPPGEPAVRIRLERAPASSLEPLEVSVAGSRIEANGPAGSAEADSRTGIGRCSLAPAVDHDTAELLDTIVLFMLTARDRTPLHAAGIVLNATTALLVGKSGSGKSTLALHALAAGHPVLSDDVIFIESGVRIWGFPRPLFLSEASDQPARLRRGKWKHPHRSDGMITGPTTNAAMFFLERGGAASVREIENAEALQRLESSLDAGFDRFRSEIASVLKVATAGSFVLTTSNEAGDAFAIIEDVLQSEKR